VKIAWRDRWGGPEVLQLRDVETPVPIGDQVLVRVHASSVNRADLDWMLPKGGWVARVFLGWRRPRRHTLGIDVAGTVEALGPVGERLARDISIDMEAGIQEPRGQPVERLADRIDDDVGISRRSRFTVVGAGQRAGDHVQDAAPLEQPDDQSEQLAEGHRSPECWLLGVRAARARMPASFRDRTSALISAARRKRVSGVIAR
jgi:hypothetical protein